MEEKWSVTYACKQEELKANSEPSYTMSVHVYFKGNSH